MKKLVVLSGAGISAESGLKTFRDHDGLWEGYRIDDVATPEAWKKNPSLVLEFYNFRRKSVAESKPNKAHQILKELESVFQVEIITQNVDDLHERAGSNSVLHLHGQIFKMRSEFNPELVYDITGDMHLGDLAEDGFQLRPDIVWFGEPVFAMENAIDIVQKADILLIIGTSLLVYPAANLIHYTNRNTSKYIIDKKIPNATVSTDIISIEMTAEMGMEYFRDVILNETA